MIVYHVDKFGLLLPGQKVAGTKHLIADNEHIRSINGFFDDKLQMFSMQILNASESGDHAFALTEAALEYVRALRFPKLPSRLAVLYASRTIEEAERWRCEMLPANPSACIVSLYTSRKVFSANFALRDEVYAAIAGSVHGQEPWSVCAPLASALLAAERYWQSIVSAHRMSSARNMGHEELLLVPPVRVLHRIAP